MTDDSGSPYHAGECEMQERAGVRERAEAAGRISIRRFMPEQHRTFFTQLPMLLIGSSDARQRPWASAIVGQPGFIHSPDPTRLDIDARPLSGDPLSENLRNSVPVGALGLEFHTRRRNRANGKVELTTKGFAIHIDQSFGNCPKYIQARQFHFHDAPAPVEPRKLESLDRDARAIIARADTFFIATQHLGEASDTRNGVDISHRGGRPGFARVLDAKTLQWPDYRGNSFFNTLGNMAADPRAGLLFVDFDSGNTLQLTGRAKVLWDWDKADTHWADAQRLVEFAIDEGVLLKHAVPLSWEYLSQAPQFAER